MTPVGLGKCPEAAAHWELGITAGPSWLLLTYVLGRKEPADLLNPVPPLSLPCSPGPFLSLP